MQVLYCTATHGVCGLFSNNNLLELVIMAEFYVMYVFLCHKPVERNMKVYLTRPTSVVKLNERSV